MAPERRDLPPDILAAPPPRALLLDAPLGTTQPLARRPAVLPVLGRPSAVDHLDRAACRLWRRRRGRLPQLQKGAQGLPLSVCRRRRGKRRRCRAGAGGPPGRGRRRGCKGKVRGAETARVAERKKRKAESDQGRKGLDITEERCTCGARKIRLFIKSPPFRFQLYRRRGKEGVPHDSKYTGRKRRAIF